MGTLGKYQGLLAESRKIHFLLHTLELDSSRLGKSEQTETIQWKDSWALRMFAINTTSLPTYSSHLLQMHQKGLPRSNLALCWTSHLARAHGSPKTLGIFTFMARTLLREGHSWHHGIGVLEPWCSTLHLDLPLPAYLCAYCLKKKRRRSTSSTHNGWRQFCTGLITCLCEIQGSKLIWFTLWETGSGKYKPFPVVMTHPPP
jgi:hypothetical protein